MERLEQFKSDCKKDGFTPLGFIGCGNMAKAIVSGLLKSKMFDPTDIVITGTKEESFKPWADLNVKTSLSNDFLVQNCRIIFLSVKPNALSSVRKGLTEAQKKPHKQFPRQTIVSILAGTSLKTLQDTFDFLEDINYIRAMPNTPLMVMAGATALTENTCTAEDGKLNFEIVQKIFETIGVVETVEESKLHAITGLSGSGPAYIYIMIEALSDAGVKQGLPRNLATKFAAQTVYGAAKTILETGLHPGVAKDQVTSAGGTTIHGIHELEKGRIRDTLINAVEAATKRSKELN